MKNKYIDQVYSTLSALKEGEEQLEEAAEQIAEAISRGGIVQCFGAGHSHMIGEEIFYRAGGLAPVKPLWVKEVLLENGASASQYERSVSFAQSAGRNLEITPGDVMIVASTSGRNPISIEIAKQAGQAGAYVIAITSVNYAESVTSRHPDRIKLHEAADLVLDTKVKAGDAALRHPQFQIPYAPVSTIIGMSMINAAIAAAIEILIDTTGEAPVFLSGNMDGSDEWNQSLIKRYEKRIPELSGGGLR